MSEDCFMKVTNKDIFLEIKKLSKTMGRLNSDVKINRWISTTALTLCFLLIGVIVKLNLK